MLMVILAVVGISGMYLRQVGRTGLLGLVAYVMFAVNFLLIMAWTFNAVAGVGYLLGGLLFGIAMYRGRILARWAALLLSAGTVATVLIPVIPHAAARATAIPVGVALAGLGWSLWCEQRPVGAGDLPADADTTAAPAGAR